MENTVNTTANNKDQQNKVNFVEIYEDRNKRAEKARKALDLLQYVIETGQINPDCPITISSVPHRNGIGTGIKISGFQGGDIFLSQEDISGLKMNATYCSVGRWGVAEINEIPSQAAFGWIPNVPALDADGNEIKTFVRKF